MPFINGRFYMNPQVGAAVEHARNNQSGGESGDEILHSGANQRPRFDDLMVHGQSHNPVESVFQLDAAE